MTNKEQKALDCTTGLNRELTTNEKLLVQNDAHLQSHITLQEKLEEIQKRISELADRIKELETTTNAMYLEVFDDIEEMKIMNPNTNIGE